MFLESRCFGEQKKTVEFTTNMYASRHALSMLTIGETYFICRCSRNFSRISPDTVSLRSCPPAIISQLPMESKPPLSASVSAAPFRCKIETIGASYSPTSGKYYMILVEKTGVLSVGSLPLAKGRRRMLTIMFRSLYIYIYLYITL
jgi:hypothetical protein